jgi:hypothetical protein
MEIAMRPARNKYWTIYLAAGAFVVVAALAAYNHLSPVNKQHEFGDTPAEVLNRNGYLEIRPGSI